MYNNVDEQKLTVLAQELILKNELFESEHQIEELIAVINYADWKYYVQDSPVLADAEYDILFQRLKDLETKFPDHRSAHSPTQRIAKGLSSQFSTVLHLVPMLSLENSYNAEDLKEWSKRCINTLKTENISYTVEPKYDGAGISVYYENDVLVRGVTRGDGIQGEDITPNIRQIKSIPLKAHFSKKRIQSIEIRGEVIIRKEVFKKYNESRIKEGLAPLANPRNAASGTLRMLDPREVAKRGLNAVLYNVSYYTADKKAEETEVLSTHYHTLKWLQEIGFASPISHTKLCNSIDEAIEYCLEFEQKRDEMPFEIDGMVVKVNSIHDQDSLGMTTHHPRWAIAYKFKARQGTSKLLRVEYQVGRTGSITPVAKIEPVAIGGVIVSSVSLFNEDVVKEKDLHIGDTILVERAGDVIPYIVKPIIEVRDGSQQPIIFPDKCPVCQEPLFKPEGEVAWRCINLNCRAQVVERIIHFASKNAMDIRNLGESNIRRFYELNIINNIADIYSIDFEKIRNLDKFGEKSIQNLREAIENSKKQSLNRLIFGLGIRYVGETTAKILSNAISNLFELKEWNEERLCTLDDIGPKVASSVYHFFQTEENIHLLEKLQQLGLNIEHSKSEFSTSNDGILSGKTFLFTGTLEKYKRSEAEALAEAKGAKILGGVSSKLNYLVAGLEAGSKLEKAKKLGSVKIISENEFIKMIE